MRSKPEETRKRTLSDLLKNYHPQPSDAFYERMDKSPWTQKEPKMTSPSRRPTRWIWQTALALVIVLIILTLSIPPARAALSAWLGLSVAPSNQMPSTNVNLVGMATQTPTNGVAPTQTAASETTAPTETITATTSTAAAPTANPARPPAVAQLDPQAGWEILTPAQLPDGFKFESAYFDTNHRMVILTYLATRPLPGATDPSLTETKSITLLQAMTNDFIPMQIAPSTKVTDVQVAGQPAVYTVGAWDSEFVPDPKDPKGGQMVSTWRNDLTIQNLYWQSGKIFLVLVCDDASVSQQALIDTAASLGQ